MLIPILLPLLLFQGDSERNQALAGPSYVPVAAADLQRRLRKGLDLLDQEKGKLALASVLPVLRDPGQDPGLPYGPRETRSFHRLLREKLRTCSPHTRADFASGLETEARQVLARLPHEPRAYRNYLRSYPGTDSARIARRRLVTILLEGGDWVGAAGLIDKGARWDEARKNIGLLQTRERERHPWPLTMGYEDGSPGDARITLPQKGEPLLRGRAGSWQLASSYARGVVGRDAQGAEFAVFQDPLRLQILEGKAKGYERNEINLGLLTGLVGGQQEAPGPALAGSRLFFVHGGGSSPGRSQRPKPAVPELFALDLTHPDRPTRVWRWSPAYETGAPFSAESRLRPRVLAAGGRVFVLLVDTRDRTNVRVHLCCLRQDQQRQGKGFARARMLWSRLLAKGSPLSASLLRSRQEDLQLSDLRPAAPILHEGTVYAGTGLGVLAAVDAGTGSLLWSFKTARAKTSSTRTWRTGKLAIQGMTVLYTPSDGQWLYRLHDHPGLLEALAEPAREARSLSRLLGVDPARPRSYFLRGEAPPGEETVQEIRPLYLGRQGRYDAPPLEGRDSLMAPPLLTRHALFLPTRTHLYCLDLARGLFYTRILEVPSRHPLGALGPILPFEGGLLIGSVLGPLAFR